MAEESKPFRILSLAGGGYLGTYTACVLAELEAAAGEPLGRKFDLIAGTSVGGILAIALGLEVPMADVRQLFVERGPEIFSDRAAPSSNVGRLIDLTRSVFGPKYNGDKLREALKEQFGARTLADAVHALAIPAVDVRRSRTKIFKTPHARGSRGDEAFKAVDVAMATSAAPAYFPSVPLGDALYADGGLYAVAPDQVALHEAEHFMAAKASEVAMLSIGTATSGYLPDDDVEFDDGAVGWLSDGRLILTLVSVQQQHVQSMMEDRLGRRYMRVDAEWPRHGGLGIDVATPKAAQALEALAIESLDSLDRRRLKSLFAISLARSESE